MKAKGRITELSEMPEYQMFPRGVWHFLGAVMLMIPAFAMIVSFASSLHDAWVNTDTSIYIDMALLVALASSLIVPTVLLTRGYADAYKFLLLLNLGFGSTLLGAMIYSLLNADFVMAGICGVGFIAAGLARVLYSSKAFSDCVERYRLIWSVYRKRKRR